MATTTPSYGKELPLKIHSTSTTVQILNLQSNGISFSTDTREVTTKDSVKYREYRPTFQDATISFEGLFSAAVTTNGFEDIIAFKDAGTEIFWEIGTGVTGTQKYTGKGYITSLDVDSPLDDNVTFSGEIQNTGDLTIGTYA
jgi:predicted secreted protein